MVKFVKFQVVALVAAGLCVSPSAALAAEAPAAICNEVTLSVAMAPGQQRGEAVRGTMCRPSVPAPGNQVDVLVHGATYNRSYWDWPGDSFYSYMDRTLASGRATFALDRVGTGASSRPSSALLTVESDAYVLHQVVQDMRDVQGFDRVATIGHSLGSVVAQYEAGQYKDVDQLVVTGFLHAEGTGLTAVPTSFYPAMLDSQFAGMTDAGYLTTLPGRRSDIFYNETADPDVLTADEANKDVVSSVEVAEGLLTLSPAVIRVTSQITAPVLVIAGAEDVFFCGLLLDCTSRAALQANEAPYYPNVASLTTHSVPNTAHNLALHPSAGESFAAIDSWSASH